MLLTVSLGAKAQLQVQKQAINELKALPLNNPYRQPTLELLYNLQQHLRINENEIEEDDRELIMLLEPLYQRDKELARQEGKKEGKQEGRQEGKQEGKQEEGQRLVTRQLNRRFGEIDSSLVDQIQALSVEQLEELAEALLDFSTPADFETWLNQQQE